MTLSSSLLLFYSLLISYTANKSDTEEWKGYVYAGAMFLVAVTMSVIVHQYWQIVFVLGMRIRTAIIGMVYAKVYMSPFLLTAKT